MTFDQWLNECERRAMAAEWVIDPGAEFWPRWFRGGLTPEQAVERLFEIVATEGQ